MSSEHPAALAHLAAAEGLPPFLRLACERLGERLRGSATDLPDTQSVEAELERVAGHVADAIRFGGEAPSDVVPSLLGLRVLDLLRAEVIGSWPEAGSSSPSADRPSPLVAARAFENVRKACWPEDPASLGAPLLDPWARELLSEVAHTLGSSFSSIVFLAEVLLHEGEGAARGDRRRQLRLLQSAALTLGTTAGDLLRLSGLLEEPEEPWGPERPTIGTIATEVASAVRPTAEERGLDLRLDLFDDEPSVERSFTLGRILLALTLAVAREGEGGSVLIGTGRPAAGAVTFRIERRSARDRGPDEEFGRIFHGRQEGEGFAFSAAGASVAAARRLLRWLGSDLGIQESGSGLLLRFRFPLD